MPVQDFCRNCDKYLEFDLRVDSQFCSDTCRHDFHNTHKKVLRAHNRAVESIAYLKTVLHGVGEEPAAVLKLLEDLQAVVNDASAGVKWKCKECGQYLFMKPQKGQVCDFCQHDKFAVIMPARLKKPISLD